MVDHNSSKNSSEGSSMSGNSGSHCSSSGGTNSNTVTRTLEERLRPPRHVTIGKRKDIQIVFLNPKW